MMWPVIAVCLAALMAALTGAYVEIKRSYKGARFEWLVKRAVGFVVSRVLPIPVPRVVANVGAVSEMASILEECKCKKPLVVTDEMLVRCGLARQCTDPLAAAGLEYVVFDQVVPGPHSELVEEGYELYVKEGCDCLIAFGGGSSIDVAKVIGAKVANPKPVPAYQGFFAVNRFGLRPLPPLIAVPTTAGTGSETTMAAVITLTAERRKIAIADVGLVPRVAVLDPKVTLGLPPFVTAATGMDTLTHAVEAYLSGWSSTFSRNLSRSASAKVFESLLVSYHEGGNVVAREAMLRSAFEAGLAFTRASLGYVHAIAHQFGGMFHTVHGVANAMLLPHVLEVYLHEDGGPAAVHCAQKLYELAEVCGMVKPDAKADAATKMAVARRFVARIAEMNAEMCIPAEVPQLRVEDVEEVAKRALAEAHGTSHSMWTSPLDFWLESGYPVPRYLTLAECKRIVEKVLPLAERQRLQEVVEV